MQLRLFYSSPPSRSLPTTESPAALLRMILLLLSLALTERKVKSFGKHSITKQSPFSRSGKQHSGHSHNIKHSLPVELSRVEKEIREKAADRKIADTAYRASCDSTVLQANRTRGKSAHERPWPVASVLTLVVQILLSFFLHLIFPFLFFVLVPPSSRSSSPSSTPPKRKRVGTEGSPISDVDRRTAILYQYKKVFKTPAPEDWNGTRGEVGFVTRIANRE